MKKQLIFSGAFVLMAFTLFAQRDETLIGKTGLKLTGAWGGGNVGIVGFEDGNHGNTGGFFGLEFNKSLFLGYMQTNGTASTTYNGSLREYDMEHGGLLIGYTYKPHKVFHPRANFFLGSGSMKVKDLPTDYIFVVQPSAGVEVNLFRWFRLGLEGGYRFVSNTSLPKPNDGDVSAAFLQLSFRFGWSWGTRFQ